MVCDRLSVVATFSLAWEPSLYHTNHLPLMFTAVYSGGDFILLAF